MFEEVDESIMQFVEDYKVHLIVPNEIQDFDKFATDFGKVMKYIAVSEDKKALEELEKEEAFKCIDVDAVRLLNAYTNSNIKIQEGEEKMDMCKGLKELLADKREEGREEGINKKLREMVQKKLAKGDLVEKIADDLMEDINVIEEIVKELCICNVSCENCKEK